MNDKKYQVFISSTYTDLAEERKKILDVLFMADCIPAGMEAFVAADTEQFEVIKKVIDLCDYYVLIIGKRYGSVHPDTGKSYTEMEYDYAIERGIPVLVFAIDDNVKLASDKIETDEDRKDKLKKFRTKAMTNRLASIWASTEDLTGKLAISIMKAKTEIKRPGWQRAVDFDEASLRREIMILKKDNEKLENDLKAAREKVSSLTEQSNIAFENKEIEIKYYTRNRDQKYKHYDTKNVNLCDAFKVISIEMLNISVTELRIKEILENKFLPNNYERGFEDQQIIKILLNQYRALELISSTWSSRNSLLYWGLTEKGRKVRDDMLLIRNS